MEATKGKMTDGGYRAIQPEGSLTLGIQYHGHGRHGNVVESMNVIGHGKESPWGWTRKVLSMWGRPMKGAT